MSLQSASPVLEPKVLAPRPLRVLLVEDSPLTRMSTHETIECLGHTVNSVDSAEAALVEFEHADRFDVLLADISLPGKSGLDLAKLCVEKYPALKVIFASAYGEVRENLGVRALSLPKPYNSQQLELVLRDVIAA